MLLGKWSMKKGTIALQYAELKICRCNTGW